MGCIVHDNRRTIHPRRTRQSPADRLSVLRTNIYGKTMTITQIYPLLSNKGSASGAEDDGSGSLALLSEKTVARSKVMGDSSKNRFLRFSASVSTTRRSSVTTRNPTALEDKENSKDNNVRSSGHEKGRLFQRKNYRYYDLSDEEESTMMNKSNKGDVLDDDGAFSIVTMSDWTFGTGLPDGSVCVGSHNAQHDPPFCGGDESLSLVENDDDDTMASSAIYSYDIACPPETLGCRDEGSLVAANEEDAATQLVLDDISTIYSQDAGYGSESRKGQCTPTRFTYDATSTIGSSIMSQSAIYTYYSGECSHGEKEQRQVRLGGFQEAVHPMEPLSAREMVVARGSAVMPSPASGPFPPPPPSLVTDQDNFNGTARRMFMIGSTCQKKVASSSPRIVTLLRRRLISAFGCFRQVSLLKRSPTTGDSISIKDDTDTSSILDPCQSQNHPAVNRWCEI
eukprot:scaffold15108_cov180-Amphora_coffeaeformis.AAC.45